MTLAAQTQKPNVLVLGGTGFVGRNLVTYLVEKELCQHVRVVDKVLPATAYLTARQQQAFAQVEFKQGNLANAASTEKAFAAIDSAGSGAPIHWNWVINLAAETKYSQAEQVYEEKVLGLTMNCARQAARVGADVFVELSTAQVYDGDKKASKEDAKTKPWTLLAKYKLKAEEGLATIPGLRYVVLRPSTIYGIGDMQGITPRLIVAAVYKELKEEMKFLWTKDLRINTVHVDDVCRAICAVAEAASQQAIPNGSVYNVSDYGDSDQEKVNTILRRIFGITTGYQGTIISNLARLSLKDVTEDINDKHMQPWSDICKRAGITSSPLTPYLDQELLYNNSLSVDGGKLEKELPSGLFPGYSVPEINEEKVREVLDAFMEVGVFPRGFIS